MSWLPLGRREIPSVIELLLPQEALHVPFTSRIRSGARGYEVYGTRGRTGAIRECILYTSGGLLLPALEPDEERAVEEPGADATGGSRAELACLLRELRPPVHSIMGIGRCVCAAEALLPLAATTRIEYFLMTVERGTLRPVLPLEGKRVCVRRAGVADAEALFPLQRGYELEEVIINPAHFSDVSCMRLLRTALKEEMVYVAEKDGVPVAKAGTNARGFGVDQIGGVYTVPEERGKGIAGVVVTELLRALMAEKPQACLFVKKRNRPAIALYDRLGFAPVTDYIISYYGI